MRTLLFLITLPAFLTACTPFRGVNGEFTGKDGTVRVHPDGRLEIIIEPRTSK